MILVVHCIITNAIICITYSWGRFRCNLNQTPKERQSESDVTWVCSGGRHFMLGLLVDLQYVTEHLCA